MFYHYTEVLQQIVCSCLCLAAPDISYNRPCAYLYFDTIANKTLEMVIGRFILRDAKNVPVHFLDFLLGSDSMYRVIDDSSKFFKKHSKSAQNADLYPNGFPLYTYMSSPILTAWISAEHFLSSTPAILYSLRNLMM